MYKFPEGLKATPVGELSEAFTAGPPSPEKVATPFPAMDVIMPEVEISRILLFN